MLMGGTQKIYYSEYDSNKYKSIENDEDLYNVLRLEYNYGYDIENLIFEINDSNLYTLNVYINTIYRITGLAYSNMYMYTSDSIIDHNNRNTISCSDAGETAYYFFKKTDEGLLIEVDNDDDL